MVVALALVLTLAVGVLRVLAPNGADAPGVLLIVPVAICAMRFGIRGGIGAACVGMALAVVTNVTMDTNQFTWLGYGTRAAALFLVGALVGSFVDRGRELESELAPHRNLSLDLIATADFDGRFTSVNGAWATTLGYGRDELLGSPLVDLVHPDDREATIAEQRKLALLGEDTLNFHNRCRHRDGSYRWLEWMIRPDVRTASFYAIARDVTTRKEAEESLRQLLEQLAIIQRAIAERSRLDEILDTIVKAAAKVLATEIVGLRLIDENDPSYLVLAASTGVDERSARVLRRGPVTEGLGGRAIVEERLLISNTYGRREGDIKMLAADGLRAAMAAPVYGHGEIVGSLVVATHNDHQFTEAEADTLGFFAEYAGVALSTARAADAVRQALTDPLTGLPNRALFVDRLDHALARAERSDGEVSVLFLDVHEFKLVNDSLGHLAGDRLLVEAAKRIRKCLRHSETAARLGGDEFAILIAHENDPVPEILGARIIEALSAPLDVDGHELRIRASIGIATGRADPESLLRDADTAMYRAKATKRGGVCVFEPGMQADSVRELELRHELLRAVACKEITAVYQPIVALSDGSIRALEVLARWNHPTRGPIPPDVFIPLAQSAGVIHEIGSSILPRRVHPAGRLACQAPRVRARAGDRQRLARATGQCAPPRHRGGARRERTPRDRAGARADRDEPAARLRVGARPARAAAQPRHPDRDRRLRHRVLLASLPPALPGRHPQDRKAVHRRDRAGRRPGMGVRTADHRPGHDARAHHRGGGHRGRRTARPPRRARLHLRAGPPLRPSRRRGRHRRPARGRPRAASAAPRGRLTHRALEQVADAHLLGQQAAEALRLARHVRAAELSARRGR